MGSLSLGDLRDPGIKPGSPALQVDSLPTAIREACVFCQMQYKMSKENIFLFLETVAPRSSPVLAIFLILE